MTEKPDRAGRHPLDLPFTPAERRPRHDGWTPERQHDFIHALAESGCVVEACGAVGMSPRSAYTLRATPAANAFRQAWDIALDYAIRRLGDAALARALHGVSRPVFYKGEQVGERRYYDERLTQFLLRYRDPVRYGRWNDSHEARRHPDGAAITLARALNAVVDAGHGVDVADDLDHAHGLDRPPDDGGGSDDPAPAPEPALAPAPAPGGQADGDSAEPFPVKPLPPGMFGPPALDGAAMIYRMFVERPAEMEAAKARAIAALDVAAEARDRDDRSILPVQRPLNRRERRARQARGGMT